MTTSPRTRQVRRLIEFYRSPARVAWTRPAPTFRTIQLAQLWWKNVAQAVTGEKTPQGAMDTLADRDGPR